MDEQRVTRRQTHAGVVIPATSHVNKHSVPQRRTDHHNMDATVTSNQQAYHIIISYHTHPFNGPFSWTTQVSRYQKGKTDLDFTEARDVEWQ